MRLAEVPADYREQVIRHCQTVAALAAVHEERQRAAQMRRVRVCAAVDLG
jgi:hypothetical protein